MLYSSADSALHVMMWTTTQSGVRVVRPPVNASALVDVARNRALMTIQDGSTHVLFCDDDMAPPPDALDKLLAVGKPAVSALCTTRGIPVKLAANKLLVDAGGNAKTVPVLDKEITGRIITPAVCGAAFLLLDISTVRALVEANLSARDWVWENAARFERMGVGRGTIEKERLRMEKLRREEYALGGGHTTFHFPYDDNGVLMYGEDIHLSLLLYRLGRPLSLHTGVHVQHIGEFPFGPQLLGVKSPDELVLDHDDGRDRSASEQRELSNVGV